MTPIKTTHEAHFSYEDGTTINFRDGKFSSCSFPFRGTYTREQWKKLAEIEAEISRLEGRIADRENMTTKPNNMTTTPVWKRDTIQVFRDCDGETLESFLCRDTEEAECLEDALNEKDKELTASRELCEQYKGVAQELAETSHVKEYSLIPRFRKAQAKLEALNKINA